MLMRHARKLLRYDDPAAPLVCCDLERLEGREEIQQDKGAYLAIRLEMSLTAGQYATMALRELMHQDTSPAFQLALSREHQRAEQTCSTSVASDCDTTMSQD
jgi:tRNA(Glu) U13 pseudouridine synthase TruD